MRYRFIFTDWFNRDLKSLRRHNPDLRSDFELFLETFDAQAHPVIPGTGGARKVRMKAKSKGKRSGYRLIYYYQVDKNVVWLITIYDKAHKETISAVEERRIQDLLDLIREKSKIEG